MEVTKDDLSLVSSYKVDEFRKSFIFISILVVRVNNIKKNIGSHQISGFGLIVGWFACFFSVGFDL